MKEKEVFSSSKLVVPTEEEVLEYEEKHPLLSGSLSAVKEHPEKRSRPTGCSFKKVILMTAASFALGLVVGKVTTGATNLRRR